ncbi:MAG: oxidoreductase family protein [Elusimicrobia bacterium]|nr:MAG: oxidoreductase family protein [Elusimicrobiota bacterium]KAF0157995.1 MAG: oxidoreductase family protein [Elusimicrobiota bacterium]
MSENKPKKMRFGVVGAGKLGGFHTRTLSMMPEVELVGVADPNLRRSQVLAWQYNCIAYKDYADLLPQVDALVVAAPTEYHAEIGLKALGAGVHVLMEKPITNSEESARKLLEMSEKKKVVLQVGHSERFNPAVVETLKHIKNPRYITIERLGPFDPRVAATGVTLDLMIHDLDILLTMMDSEVESFEAIGASMLSSHEDISNVRIKFRNGCVADITASRATMEASRRMRVYQQDAYISVDYVSARLKIYRKKVPTIKTLRDIEITYPKLEPKQPIREELAHFIDCIRTSKTPTPSGEKGLMALRLALDITDKMRRFEVSEPEGPDQAESLARSIGDIGKATRVLAEEALRNSGIDKS